jgi:anti-sigma28 factor (negative regulator of flagellin synthesis)
MKVYDLNISGTQTGAANRSGETGATQHTQAAKSGASRSAGTSADSDGDRVEFSNTLGRLSNALSADDSVRSAKVNQLAAQYQAGNYQPNSAGAAHGMISEAMVG